MLNHTGFLALEMALRTFGVRFNALFSTGIAVIFQSDGDR
jgi:hypothetical protein